MKNTIINLIFPVAIRVLRAIHWMVDLPTRYSNERQRRIVLNRKFANMTDPTFLDRALAGEKKDA